MRAGLSNYVNYQIHEDVAVICMTAPPVNSLGPDLRAALMETFEQADRDSKVVAVVLTGSERMFCGGADIKEFEKAELVKPDVNDLCARIEAMQKPVVAAIGGFALGGGLELAMSCHYRVALENARVGLPEVTLGILPGAGGTQRLPRLVGVERALGMMLSGSLIHSKDAADLGLVDLVVSAGDMLRAAERFALDRVDQPSALRVTSQLTIDTSGLPGQFFASERTRLEQKKVRLPAEIKILECVELAANTADFALGLAFEWESFKALMHTPESRSLRHLFFAERDASKIPGLAPDMTLRAVQRVGIVGAGTMGGGIAMNFVSAGIPVTIQDVTQAALERGLALVRKNFQAAVDKGRMTAAELEQRMGLLTGTTNIADLSNADLVIEAVFENMALKLDVCAQLGRVCKPGAMIASNTSTLNVDEMALATGRPSDVLGTHFFSPANVMRLLEVVRAAQTSPDVLSTVVGLARKIGKVAVVSGVCYGFIGNRMLEGYLRETDFLLLEGASPGQIDRAIEAFGMAMGPCRMMDMSGVDVNAMVLEQQEIANNLPNDRSYRQVCRSLHALGRDGQKKSRGYYRYEGRIPVADPEFEKLSIELAAKFGIARRTDIDDKEIVERCLLPLINEGYRILEEGISYRSSDIDVVWTAGYGFPRHKGGPMFYSTQLGPEAVAAALKEYGKVNDDPHGYWKPAQSLSNSGLARH